MRSLRCEAGIFLAGRTESGCRRGIEDPHSRSEASRLSRAPEMLAKCLVSCRIIRPEAPRPFSRSPCGYSTRPAGVPPRRTPEPHRPALTATPANRLNSTPPRPTAATTTVIANSRVFLPLSRREKVCAEIRRSLDSSGDKAARAVPEISRYRRECAALPRRTTKAPPVEPGISPS